MRAVNCLYAAAAAAAVFGVGVCWSSHRQGRSAGPLLSCEYGIKGSFPSVSPALLSLTSHLSNSPLSAGTAALSFRSLQSYNTLALITQLTKAWRSESAFLDSGGAF